MIDAYQDQDEFVRHMAYTANDWLGPMPADCPELEPLAERLDGFVFSLFPELEGAGRLPRYRLSPKGRPDVNLVDHYLHDTWPNVDDDNVNVRTFLTNVQNALRLAQQAATADGNDPRDVMLLLGYSIFLLIERSYELRPQFFDANDRFTGEGDDVAPGLPAAFRAYWADTPGGSQ